DAREVVGDGDRPERGRDVDRVAVLLGGGDLRVLHRRVAAGEVDALVGEVGDSLSGAGRLVVDRQPLALQLAADLLVDRGGEGGAGAVEGDGARVGAPGR